MPRDVVEVRNLVKRFDGRDAVLDGVDLAVAEHGFAVIYGKSGCGKTTLLNILGGLDRPTSGDVLLDGEQLVGASEDHLARIRIHKVGFVFQDYNLLDDLTVQENVALPLTFARKQDSGKVVGLLKSLGLDKIQRAYPNTISGGEAQRVAVARALINDPKVILADEPTGNLDTENAQRVIETLDLARREFGATVILATHDPHLVRRATTTEAVHLENGKATVDFM